jgi:4-amino-4-deoxy-L-arabinose transferase-like glycosyltransferase
MVKRHDQSTAFVLAAVPVFVVALALYLPTLLPDVGLWDTAEFQAIGPVLGTAHPTGYPTYTLAAWLGSVVLQPFGNEAYRANLLSALLMAAAASLLAVRVVQATRLPGAGLIAGAAFALTPVAWSWGLRADPHALHVFFAALLLVLLGAWAGAREHTPHAGGRWLLAAAVVFSLSLGNHALTLLLAPGIAAYVLLVAPRILWREPRLVLACLIALVMTTVLVYLYLPLRASMDPPLEYANPGTLDGFWYVVLGQQFQGTFDLPPLAGVIADGWDEVVRNYGLLAAVAFAGAALGLLRHPRLTVLGLLWFACTWLFALGYPNANIERYYLVPLLVAALWLALAVEAVWVVVGDHVRGSGHESVARYGLPATGLLLIALLALAAPDRARTLDASRDAHGRAFLDATFAAVAEDAVIVSWWSFSTPLWYGQHVEGRRPDITVIDDRDVLDDGYGTAAAAIAAHVGRRPVYVVRQERELSDLREDYVLTRVEGVPAEMYLIEVPAEER